MKGVQDIRSYYDELAERYDKDRFANSYGRYLHHQEVQALKKALPPSPEGILDFGCGTGRFLSMAEHGMDLSESMLAQARKRFPEKKLVQGSLPSEHFAPGSLKAVFSMHVCMHLDPDTIIQIIQDVHKVLAPGGRFVFDIPSRKRRELTGYRAGSWHGATAMNKAEIVKAVEPDFKLRNARGLLYLPIHRVPARMRPAFRGLDNLLCQSPLWEFASYLLITLEKR